MFKVWQRLCWSGECRLCRRHPEGKPIVPGRTTERSIYNAARICPNKIQFITPGMSLLEAIFRILIVNGNQPMKFSEIVDRLKENWAQNFRKGSSQSNRSAASWTRATSITSVAPKSTSQRYVASMWSPYGQFT